MSTSSTVEEFWGRCRERIPGLPFRAPEAWAFGATPEHADELLELVHDGIKTGTSSPLWDYEYAKEPVPSTGDFSIVLDGRGVPQVLIETISVSIVPFDEVSEEHAQSEGEGERTLSAWRDIHERFWRDYSENPRAFEPNMPVVCERFRVLYSQLQE